MPRLSRTQVATGNVITLTRCDPCGVPFVREQSRMHVCVCGNQQKTKNTSSIEKTEKISKETTSQLSRLDTEEALHELIRPELDGPAKYRSRHPRRCPSPERGGALFASNGPKRAYDPSYDYRYYQGERGAGGGGRRGGWGCPVF